MSSKTPEIKVTSETGTEATEPSQYKVLIHNDDYTTMDFVVLVLEAVFNKTSSESVQIMLNVHNKGIGVCGVYTYEVAETKITLVQSMAQKNNFPLKCSIERA